MRKASVTTQMFRTARRFSAAVAPQLTKIDQIVALQRYRRLVIRIASIEKLQDAIKSYVLHTHVHFDPVDFEIRANDGTTTDPIVLTAQFYAEEIVLFDGTKRLLSISLTDSAEHAASGDQGPVLAKVRHPLSGIKVFEIVESALSLQNRHCDAGERASSWRVNSIDAGEMTHCYIETQRSLWRCALSLCGFSFCSEWWSVQKEEHNPSGGCGGKIIHRHMGTIIPCASLWDENAVRVEWMEEADSESRLLILCFGIIQTIREAYPSLLHIIEENRKRKVALANA